MSESSPADPDSLGFDFSGGSERLVGFHRGSAAGSGTSHSFSGSDYHGSLRSRLYLPTIGLL